jgi:hypothetical protein
MTSAELARHSRLEVVSAHIPKTGGTSFYLALAAHYGDDIIFDHDHIPGHPRHDLSEPPCLPDHVRAVHGHFCADRYADYRNAFLVTFLRDPVERFLSGYFYWITFPSHESPVPDEFRSDPPPLLEFAAHYAAGMHYEAYMGKMDLSRFDFVGFHDRRARDCRTLSKVLGFEIDGNMHENKTLENSRRSEAESNARLQAQLRDILWRDCKLYDAFRTAWT